MQTKKKCIRCFYKQARRTAGFVTNDPAKFKKIDNRIKSYLKRVSFECSPADISTWCVKIAHDVIGCNDPYSGLKQKYTKIAASFYPKLKKIVKSAADPVLMGLRVAVAGNIIDLGILKTINIEKTLKKALHGNFPLGTYRDFKKVLDGAQKILYVTDNSGEIFFDRPLIEELIKTHKVIISVKSNPILNDATMQDAINTGLTKIAKVITTGNGCLGVNWKRSSMQFRKTFRNSDLILAKGQANYETLENFRSKKPIFMLSQSKCPMVAEYMGIKVGEIVFLQNKFYHENTKSRKTTI